MRVLDKAKAVQTSLHPSYPMPQVCQDQGYLLPEALQKAAVSLWKALPRGSVLLKGAPASGKTTLLKVS